MSKVIILSRQFPSYHLQKGEHTYFVEKIYNAIYGREFDFQFDDFIKALNPNLPDGLLEDFRSELDADIDELKFHTIRAGYRWRKGDKASLRVWSGKPYQSKQIILCPDIEIKNVINIEILGLTVWVGEKVINNLTLHEIAKNDGLDFQDFQEWFKKLPFRGQILCFTDNVEY